jgi:hypothetical protein
VLAEINRWIEAGQSVFQAELASLRAASFASSRSPPYYGPHSRSFFRRKAFRTTDGRCDATRLTLPDQAWSKQCESAE